MTDMLCTKDRNTYFISTHKGEIHVAKQIKKNSGFLEYEEIYHHNLTLHDIHQIKQHGGNKKYKLIKDISKEKLPLHITEEKNYEKHPKTTKRHKQ